MKNFSESPPIVMLSVGFSSMYLIIASSIVLFDSVTIIKYTYDGDTEYKTFKMSGNSLVMVNTSGTILSACTLGEAKQISVRNNNNNYWWCSVSGM